MLSRAPRIARSWGCCPRCPRLLLRHLLNTPRACWSAHRPCRHQMDSSGWDSQLLNLLGSLALWHAELVVLQPSRAHVLSGRMWAAGAARGQAGSRMGQGPGGSRHAHRRHRARRGQPAGREGCDRGDPRQAGRFPGGARHQRLSRHRGRRCAGPGTEHGQQQVAGEQAGTQSRTSAQAS